MKKVIVIFTFFTAFFNSKGQNLVPNYSFEDTVKCPDFLNQITGYVSSWKGIGAGSYGYYDSICNPSGNIIGVPLNNWGYQEPHTGSAYVGIYTFIGPPQSPDPYDYNARDYIQIGLIDSLKSTVKYFVTFYISLADSSKWACNDIGVYFSDSLLVSTYSAKSYITPQVQNDTSNHLIDKINWMKVSGNFIAKGGEKYIVIGNFKGDKQSDSIFVNSPSANSSQNWELAYYYIDDIIVSTDSNYADSLFQSVPNINAPQAQVKVFPNPSTGVFNFQSSGINKELNIEVYNALGQQVYSSLITHSSSFIVNLRGQPRGVYLYRLTDKAGELVQSGKLMIE